jgi:hypothetical protein
VTRPDLPLALLGSATLLFLAAPAQATPHPLPFSYPYATLPQGQTELEQYVDLIPVRVAREDPDTTRAVTSVRSELTTEFEHGVTDALEVGFYLAFRQGATADTPALRFEGIEQRARYRFCHEGDLPVDTGLYLEVAEFHNEIELEEKLLLSKRLGPVTVLSNLWVEQEYYFQDKSWKLIYHPTLGVTYETMPSLFVGLEYWAEGRFDEVSASEAAGEAPIETRHYAGPALMVQGGGAFLGVGAYARLDELGPSAAVGDPWGPIWVRTLVGVHL